MSPTILVEESDTGFLRRGSGPPTELQILKMRNFGQLRPSLDGAQRYLSGSPMSLASDGMIEVMLMRTLTDTFLA